MLKVTVARLDLSYEAVFANPAFELTSRLDDILRSIHRALLSSNISVGAKAFNLDRSDNLADAKIRVELFNGHAGIVVSADRYYVRFESLKTDDHVKLAHACGLNISEALSSALPQVFLRTGRFLASGWYKSIDGDASVIALLNGDASDVRNFPSEFLGGIRSERSIKGEIFSNDSQWSTSYTLEKSRLSEADIYFSCETSYVPDASGFTGMSVDFESRAHHFRGTVTALLGHFGIEVEQ